jgi:hypothetical protein
MATRYVRVWNPISGHKGKTQIQGIWEQSTQDEGENA